MDLAKPLAKLKLEPGTLTPEPFDDTGSGLNRAIRC
jgi:hypothetical protein